MPELRPFKLEMPVLRADLPIYVAALKQKAIEQIGECADGWIPTFWPYERIADGKAWIATGAARLLTAWATSQRSRTISASSGSR